MGFGTRHAGLLSGLAVLSLFVLILPSLLLFLLCKRGQGRSLPESKIWKCTFPFPGTKVIYPKWCREVLYSGESAYLQFPPHYPTASQNDSPKDCMVFRISYWDHQHLVGDNVRSRLALPLPGCAPLGIGLTLSGSEFPHMK